MADVVELEKTRPITVLESRRAAILKWLESGRASIATAQSEIKKHQEEAIEMLAEVEEIEVALKALYAVQEKGAQSG